MAVARQAGNAPNLVSYEEWSSRKRDEARNGERDDEAPELTEAEQEQFKILRYCANIYRDARSAREPHETFDVAWQLFIGDVWSQRWPAWRARITINKIRAFITFMQAIMTDNKPRWSVDPVVDGSQDAADLLRKLSDRDWEENNMQLKISTFVLYGLIWGTSFMKVTYDPYADAGRGKHVATPVVPYRIYTNRTATCIEDAEYIIQVEDMTMGWVRRNFPKQARAVSKLKGRVSSDGERDRDYIREGEGAQSFKISSAQNVDGNIVGPQFKSHPNEYFDGDDDTVEVAEYWLRDDSLEAYQREVIVDGQVKMQPVVGENGQYVLEEVGKQIATSEIDGASFTAPVMAPKMEPVMETAWRLKYPNGRLVLIAAGKVLLRDIPNPYQTDGFPYAMWKDYDVGAFWGQGEPLALKDCAIAINRIASQVFEILEKVGNPSWKLLKGGGVNAQSIKNKPGSVIPMDDMNALAPLDKPPIPGEFFTLYKLVSDAMGEVSGINEAVRGGLPAANTAFATMDQLQESGAAPIRLKVRNLESGIARIGKLRIQLIQQFDRGQRPLRLREDSLDPDVVQPVGAAEVQFRNYTAADLQGQVEFSIVPISSLSTSPAGLWNKWMTMYDKHLIDRRWWHSKQRIEGYKTELPRMEKQEARDAELAAAAKQKAKPGPAPLKPGSKAHRAKKPPPSNLPTRADNAFIR